MRRLFCAQSPQGNNASDGITRLCLGAATAGNAHIAVPASLRSGGGIAQLAGGRKLRRPKPYFRASTVLKLMVVLLLIAALAGWRLRHHLARKRLELFREEAPSDSGGGDGSATDGTVVGRNTCSARRRTMSRAAGKRARVDVRAV